MGMRSGRVRSEYAHWVCASGMRIGHAQWVCAVGMRSGHGAMGMRSGPATWDL